MTTLTLDVDVPGGVDPTSVRTTVQLWGDNGPVVGHELGTGKVIAGPRTADGPSVSIDNLVGNADVDLPAGTVYRVEVAWAGLHDPIEMFVTLPTSGTHAVGSILTAPPGALPSAALSAHIADTVAHGNGRRLWVARKTDATFATASTTPIPVTGWSRSDTVPVGDWMVEASAEAFADLAANGGTLGLWVDLAGTAISRSGGVVTATFAAGHGVLAGADVIWDGTVNSFDGRFAAASPTSTTLQWTQAGANESGGTGTLSIRLGVNASFRNAGTIRAVAHVPDVWWAPTAGVAYTLQPRFNASVGTVTLLTGPFFGLPGQGVMTAETR